MSTNNQYLASKERSKSEYEKNTRRIKPVSFNKHVHAKILKIADDMDFSVWVKNLLVEFTPAEVAVMKGEENPKFIPMLLIEKALDEGLFDLDAYLEAKGKKIIDIQQVDNHLKQIPEYDETCQLSPYDY